jgi:hypothetical protein
MRIPFIRLFAFLLSAFCWAPASGQAPPEAAATNEDKRLAVFEAEFAAGYLREVRAPFEAKIKELDAKYDTALARALEASNRAGRLDESLALRGERQRVGDGTGVPATDGPADPDLLRQLRTTYRAERHKLEAERDLAAAPLLAAHDAKLEAYQKELTTQGKLDEALLVKGAREKAAERLREGFGEKAGDSTPTGASPAPPSMIVNRGGESLSFREWLATVFFEQFSGHSTMEMEGDSWRITRNETKEFFLYPIVSIDEASSTVTWRFPNGDERSLSIVTGRKRALQDKSNFWALPRDTGPSSAPPSRLEIVEAAYGSSEQFTNGSALDVTKIVRASVVGDALVIEDTVAAFGDPHPLRGKVFKLKYRFDGKSAPSGEPFEYIMAEKKTIRVEP